MILKRQEAALKRYKAAYEQLLKDIEEINRLEGERKIAVRENDPTTGKRVQEELQGKLKAVREELKKSGPKTRHLPPERDSLPNRMREIKKPDRFDLSGKESNSKSPSGRLGAVERPEQDKVSFLQKIYDFILPSAFGAEPGPAPEELAPTLDAPITQEIIDLAVQLDNNAVKIYEFVRNGFEFEAYRSSMKGASQTLVERAGNDVDLASLLIALYRAAGIGARYVQGTIELPIDRAKAWVGIDDPEMVGALFMSQGIPTTLMYQGAEVAAVRLQHVWVEAYVPFLNGRGALTGPGDTWVQMDPSFKTHTITQTLDLPNVPIFDQAAYLSTFRTESPLDFYKANLQTFLDTEAPNYVPAALARNKEIDFEFLGILVGQPPYSVLSIDSTYAEIPDSLRQKFTLTVEDTLIGETQLTYTVPLPSVIGKRLTLSYAAATPDDEQTITAYGNLYDTPPYLINLVPQVKLEGQVVAQGNPIGSGEDQIMRFTFDDGFFMEQVENILIAGEYYAIALDGQNVTLEEAFLRSERLAENNETIDLGDPTTLDERLGELLYLSALTFQQNLDAGVREIAPLHKVIDVRDVSEMMYFLTVQVNNVFGVPSSLTLVGLTGDLDRDTHLVVPVDGDLSRIKPFITLEGTQSSYLEHSVTEGIYSESISAVKAIQLANDQLIPVHIIIQNNVLATLPLLQLSPELETEIENAVNSGMEVTVPESNLVILDWTGVGYLILDPSTGAGAYRISGGFGGTIIIDYAVFVDKFQQSLGTLSKTAFGMAFRPLYCFPGEDSVPYTGLEPCFRIVLLHEIKEEPGICGPDVNLPSCYEHYGVNHPWYAPLIDTQGRTNEQLTERTTVENWRSKDDSRYMRAGISKMVTLEVVTDYFEDNFPDPKEKIGLTIDSGYRSYTHNFNETQKPGSTASKKSYHVDGWGADFRIVGTGGGNIDIQCEVLAVLYLLTLGVEAEVKEENKDNTVHLAIPTVSDTDDWDC